MAAGVIRGVTMDVSEKDHQSPVRAVVPAYSVHRFRKSEALKILHAAQCLPEHDTPGETCFKGNPFLENSLQWHKCCRFGYVAVPS